LLGEDDSYQADKSIAFRATGGGLTIKAFVQDEDATPLVVKNIGSVIVGEGVKFDANLVTTGLANPFAFVGCGKVVLPRALECENFWQAEVCGSSFRRGDELHMYDVRLKNCIGASGFFAGKPYGVTDVFHSGTVYATVEDGAGAGALTVDNDPTGDDDDMSVVSATASGTTVTL